MRIHALLSWFDEPVEFLSRAVRSAAASGVHSIIAVDGAYEMLPGGRGSSDPKQAKAIMAAARAGGIDCVLACPQEVWPTEMAKRNYLFELANVHAERGDDWFFVIDADYEIRASPDAFQAKLFTVEDDVAEVFAYTPKGPNGEVTFGPPERMEFRALFRAQEITVEGNHYSYVGRDGDRLWGSGIENTLARATNLAEYVQITHWTYYRPKQRNRRQYDYYRARDASLGERPPCFVCHEATAVVTVPKFFKEGETIQAGLIEVCDACYPIALQDSRDRIEEWGIDDMVAEQRAV